MDADEKVKILQAFVNANKEAKKRMAHVEKLFAPDSPDVKKKKVGAEGSEPESESPTPGEYAFSQ